MARTGKDGYYINVTIQKELRGNKIKHQFNNISR